MAKPTAEYVRSRLYYDPDTGIFTWKAREVRAKADKVWNTKYAGKRAGYPTTKGHIQIKIDRVAYAASHLAWLLMRGVWPSLEVDHENRVRNDDRWLNLREATSSQNSANMKKPITNKSGFKGVHRQGTVWRVQINVQGKKKHIGLFKDARVAASAYDAAATKYHGAFALLNFPKEAAFVQHL